MEKNKNICPICGQEFEGFGNNPQPVSNGRCCNDCNQFVVAARCYNTSKQETGSRGAIFLTTGYLGNAKDEYVDALRFAEENGLFIFETHNVDNYSDEELFDYVLDIKELSMYDVCDIIIGLLDVLSEEKIEKLKEKGFFVHNMPE